MEGSIDGILDWTNICHPFQSPSSVLRSARSPAPRLQVAGSGALAADAAPEARAARGGRRPLMVSEKHRVVTQETRPVCLFSVCGCLGVTTRSAANGRTAAGNIDDIRRRRRTSVTALTNYYHYGSNECPGITSRPFPQTSRRRPGASAAARGAEPC